MNKICLRIIFLLICLICWVNESLAQVATFRHLESEVQKFTLSNGLRVVFFRRPNAPVFSGQIWVKVGGVNEIPGSTGVAHLLEHMAFKGTTTIGTKDYQKEKPLLARLEELMVKESNGVLLSDQEKNEVKSLQEDLDELSVDNEFGRLYSSRGSLDINAATSKDYTFYTVNLPSAAFEFWCWMESDRLLNPVFRQFYKEREVVHEERRMRVDDSPAGKLYEGLLAASYWNHPNRLPVIGWPSDLKRLTATATKQLYQTYYRPDNMVIALVGDLDLEQIKLLIEKYFGRLSAKTDPIPQVQIVEEKQEGPRDIIVEFNAQPLVMIAYHKPTFPDPVDLHFSVLHSLLSDGRSSILHKELVLERQLAMAVETTEAPGTLFPPVFIVSAVPRNGVSNQKLIEEIQKILDRLKKQLISSDQIQSAKRRVRGHFLRELSSNQGLAEMLGETELLYGNWKVLIDIYNGIIQTSAEDIQRLVLDHLNVSNRTVARLEKKQ